MKEAGLHSFDSQKAKKMERDLEGAELGLRI